MQPCNVDQSKTSRWENVPKVISWFDIWDFAVHSHEDPDSLTFSVEIILTTITCTSTNAKGMKFHTVHFSYIL